MGCAENEATKSAISASSPSSLFPSVGNCIWVDVNSPHSTSSERCLCIHTTTSTISSQNLEAHCEVLALPTSHQTVVESNPLDANASRQFLLASDQTAIAHATNTFAMQSGCSPPRGSPVAYSKVHAAHAKMHIPSLYSPVPIMVGSTLLGNAAVQALPRSSSVTLSSGNDVAHATLTPTSSAAKEPPARLDFMQSYVNTLVPQLKRINSQSSSISLKEKFSAVRLAADMSLAISAGGVSTWSQALFQKLTRKVGTRKNKARNPSTLRGRIYTSILRKSTLRGGSHATRMRARARSHASYCEGTDSLAFTSISRDCYHASLSSPAKRSHENLSGPGLSGSLSGGSSHAMCCRKGRNVCRMRRVAFQRRFSYVKILRNSRSAMKLLHMKSPTDPGHEASKAHPPSISKEHIASLSRLVPGGRSMDVPLLFQEAADYILSLQMQVEVLQSLSFSV